MTDIYTLFFDGACGPKNPGGTAAYGFTLHHGPDELKRESGVVGTGPQMSNNVAEYAGLTSGMSAFLEYILSRVRAGELWPEVVRSIRLQVFGDSQLVIYQMDGTRKAHGGLYYPYYEQAKEVASAIRRERMRISFDSIPREQNKVCDRLSKAYVKLT